MAALPTASQCSVRPAPVVLLPELEGLAPGESVRIAARVVAFDAGSSTALVEMNGVQARVRTDIMVCRDPPLRDLFGFIGEIEQDRSGRQFIRARLGFRLHGLALDLYHRAALARRDHLHRGAIL